MDGGSAPSSLNHFPAAKKWEFDESVANVFPDMIKRSISGFEDMRATTNELARHFVRAFAPVIDLGASHGGAIDDLSQTRVPTWFVAVENSPAMLAVLRKKWPTPPKPCEPGSVYVEDYDIGNRFRLHAGASVFLSILTLQFVPLEKRAGVVESVYKSLRPGGAFFLVEKVTMPAIDVDRAIRFAHRVRKQLAGYSSYAIERKADSLAGVLVPIDAHANESMLREAGFKQVECYWRSLNFAGFIAVK